MQPTTDRAQVSAKAAVSIVVVLAVAAIVTAFLLPIGVGALTSTSEVTQTTDELETESVTSTLNVTVDSVTTDTEAMLTLTVGEDSDQQTITESGTETFNVDGNAIDVTLDDAGDGEITATYEIPRGVGWSAGASALWFIIDIMIVLAAFLFFIGVALKAA